MEKKTKDDEIWKKKLNDPKQKKNSNQMNEDQIWKIKES
jgi:hypothetical protein